MKYLVFIKSSDGYELIFDGVSIEFIKEIKCQYDNLKIIPESQLLNVDDFIS